MQITEKQKQQLLNLNDSRVNEILNVLEDNTWYIYEDESIQFNRKNGKGYGYSKVNGWNESCEWLRYPNCNGLAKKATKQEIEQALTTEAKRRGFKEGVRFKDLHINKEVIIDEIRYYDDSEDLRAGGYCIFYGGQWAEIIDEKAELKQEIKELEVKLQELREKL